MSGATLVNTGTIEANTSGGIIQIESGLPFTNEGTIAAAGGTIEIESGGNTTVWSNTGSVSVASGSTLDLDGSFTQAGTFSNTGGTVNLMGTIASGGLSLNSATGSWILAGGTIDGGTITTSNGTELIGSSSTNTLNGVTLNGTLDLTQVLDASATIEGGMTLNGTINVGSTSGTTYGKLNFSGASQTISGTGTIDFGNGGGFNGMNIANTVTLGVVVEGIQVTIQEIGSGSTFINTGTIEANANGTIEVGDVPFTNDAPTRPTLPEALSPSSRAQASPTTARSRPSTAAP